MMQFENRQEAGRLLAQKLPAMEAKTSLVLAIPRGGVPVGYEISRLKKVPLDIVVTRKVGHPRQPEYAVCAVTENRYVLCDERIRSYLDADWLKQAIETEQREALRRRELYAAGTNLALLTTGKKVVVVDDGIATGLTMLAAVQELLSYRPQKMTVAAPVVSPEAYEDLQAWTDEVIALYVPEYFGAVGVFYKQFLQTSDEEVIEWLKKAG
jgi:putative phosphoribosyl transferase